MELKISNINDSESFPSGEGGEALTLNEAAQQFVNQMNGRTIFAFYGKMGAGKTTFIKAICTCLGVKDTVASPTFALVNEYRTSAGAPVFHFDFYRIKKLDEVLDMGYEDYIDSGALCLMEWPELIEEILPDDAVRVTIEEADGGSRVVKF